jgi:hypothetical protein
MKHEFNVKKYNDVTVYTLESASSGATGSGNGASVSMPIGGVRKRGDNLIAQEGDTIKVPVTQKPRQGPLRPQTGGGAHRDKKKEQKQGKEKHRKPFAEDHEVQMASNELKSIHANAKRLLTLVQQYGEQGDLEAWQQSKITKAADYLNSVLQSIGGEQSDTVEGLGKMRGNMGAYDADVRASQSGMGRGSDHRGLGQELAHETNNIAISINGRLWKVVPGRGTADSKEEWSYLNNMKQWAEKKSASSGKKWTVSLTGANVTEGVAEGDHEGMYSPEAIKMGNHFIKEFNLIDDMDQQLAIEIVDNCLDGGLTDPNQIRKQVIKYLKQSGTVIQSRKQGVAEGDEYFAHLENMLNEDWQKVNKRDKTDGMSRKAVKAYRRENPGSKLKTAVTTKPSKLKKGGKAAKRRKSFCARMSGNKGPMKKPNGKPTPKALALRRWNCEEDAYMNSLNSQVLEKLNPQAPVDVWIQDFQKADPNKYHQFKNKTPAKKAQMAVAASYAAKNPSKKK